MLKLGQVLTLKNCIEPFSYASTAYVVASALVSVRPICKNLSNLQKIFGQMVYRPPLAKNSPYAYADINLCTFFGLCLLKILLASSDQSLSCLAESHFWWLNSVVIVFEQFLWFLAAAVYCTGTGPAVKHGFWSYFRSSGSDARNWRYGKLINNNICY